ncbi:MAG: hypothetical protein ACN6O3_04270 [Comamonas sp.]
MTLADSQVGCSTFAINVLAYPSGTVQRRLSDMQDAIESAAPADSLYRCPATTLHLSVFQFVWARSPVGAMDRSAWLGRQGQAVEALARIASSSPSFVLSQERIHAGESAVFLRFDPSPLLEQLRDGIAAFAADDFPACNRPDIQHITLFRYRQRVALSEAEAACQRAPAFCDGWKIDRLELELVQETSTLH